jgi:hypothetical protein
MRKLYWCLFTLVLLAFSMTACAAQSVQAASKPAPYEGLLGKSLTDQDVSGFIAANHCSSVEELRHCKEIGVVLGANSDLVVQTVFLYLENTDGFTAFQGELPFGLRRGDSRETVETKLKEQRVGTGMANEEGLFDRTHCWATYYAAGMTIIYNSPSAHDKNATMHAIIVENRGKHK